MITKKFDGKVFVLIHKDGRLVERGEIVESVDRPVPRRRYVLGESIKFSWKVEGTSADRVQGDVDVYIMDVSHYGLEWREL